MDFWKCKQYFEHSRNNDDWERALVSEYLTGAAQALEWLCRTDGLTTPGELGQAVARVAAHLGLNRAQ